ncbi:hypothetical protein [Methylosinus sporium]|uniref:Uncharacterized protein n=1 Tax=Methylosinus sporium TaxID=428 RepID=A0A2U1SSN1_METSR|nr:hypothetical protein [Methylosinus sporium]PWB94624.1 hypothetical protein C5689_06060 [Methylosinus sporium]
MPCGKERFFTGESPYVFDPKPHIGGTGQESKGRFGAPTPAEVDRMLAEFIDAPSMDFRESVRHALEDFVTRRRDGLAGLLLALSVGTGATLPTAENGLQCAPTMLVYLYILPTDDALAMTPAAR